jgi:hypothetical protein
MFFLPEESSDDMVVSLSKDAPPVLSPGKKNKEKK